MSRNIIFFIIASFPMFLESQSIFPAGKDNPIWKIGLDVFDTPLDSSERVQYVKTAPDTLLCGSSWTPFELFDHRGRFIQRQGYYKIEGNKVWMRLSTDCSQKQHIVYDFDMQLGDTATLFFAVGGFEHIQTNPDSAEFIFWSQEERMISGELKNVRFLLINYQEHKYSIEWIDGIGALSHPFFTTSCFEIPPYDDEPCLKYLFTQCLQTNTGLLYQYSLVNACSNPWEKIIYVNNSAVTGANDGSSWPNAFTNLQDALAVAIPGNEIWVAKGTYYPTDDTNREKFFQLRSGVKLYGGFAGNETETKQRDMVQYPTILSGDIGIKGNDIDNSFHILYGVALDSSTLLDGFTITQGQATPDDPSRLSHYNYGAGLMMDATNEQSLNFLTIQNCNFISNYAWEGGAVYLNAKEVNWEVNADFFNCIFEDNSAFSGGALCRVGGTTLNTILKMNKCQFRSNSSKNTGGAILFTTTNHFSVLLDSCNFSDNKSVAVGGAIYFNGIELEGRFKCTNSIFKNNIGNGGGAIAILIHPTKNEYHIIFEHSDFYQNSSNFGEGGAIIVDFITSKLNLTINSSNFINNQSASGGGGLFISSNQNTILKCFINKTVFSGNTSISNPIQGAFFYKGHPFNVNKKADILVSNSGFFNNQSAITSIGGNSSFTYTRVINCTFFNNGQASISKDWKKSVWRENFDNITEVQNSIIWDERVQDFYRLIANRQGNTGYTNTYGYVFKNTLISHPNCTVEGGETTCGPGMIFGQYPLFRDTASGDFRLVHCSPAVDAGSLQDFDTLASPVDLAGSPRVQGPHIDMGAYETTDMGLVVGLQEDISCHNGSNGLIQFQYEDPSNPVTWSRQDASGMMATGTGSQNLAAGAYTFFGQDSLGCRDTIEWILQNPPAIEVMYEVDPASTFQSSDGNIMITAVLNGQAPFRYLWNTGDTTRSLTNRPAGSYSLLIEDAAGCRDSLSIVLSAATATQEAGESKAHFTLQPNILHQDAPLLLQYNLIHSGPLQLSVFDATGKYLLARTHHVIPDAGVLAVKLPHLAPGVYILRVQDGQGRPVGLRFVVW